VNIHQTSSVATSSGFTSFVIGHLRHAQARINLASNEIAATLVGVRSGWFSADDAVAHLHDCGLLNFVIRERSSQ
jgi:hypothetical protein